ncbi:cleavage stimulating factor 64 [Quercus suber]|uniref:Cleavage stimulating factor 64 n=1 Tax=Quercus suber TaxID=58331 RepID=A0AAW0J152_QUESU|nr:cleavage stimulating factor 64 [Quercus suber]
MAKYFIVSVNSDAFVPMEFDSVSCWTYIYHLLVSTPQSPQSQLPPEVESALLQQVLNLTPEQLSSLPPEQQQQVIQLQQVLRRDQIQPS